MAATGAKLGTRTRFLREDPVGGGVFTATAEVKHIGGPKLSRDSIEATTTESPDDHAEFIPGLANGGEVALVLNFRPEHVSQGATAGLLKDFQDGTVRNWRIEWPQFPNTPTLTFPGFLTGWEPSSAAKELISVAVAIKVTGKTVATNFA
jgi:hypothetical protein